MMQAMINVDSAILRIKAYADHMGWKKSRLAKEAGFSSDRTLKDIYEEGWNPTAATLRRLEKIIPNNFPNEDHDSPRNGRNQRMQANK